MIFHNFQTGIFFYLRQPSDYDAANPGLYESVRNKNNRSEVFYF